MTTIMVIDDDDLFVKTMEMFLENKGYEVIYAFSGAGGSKKLRTFRPDLLLLDIMMPGMDGWKVLEGIKSDEKLTAMPVIMITARSLTTDILINKAMLGFTGYIKKPFELEELYTRITQALQS